VAQLELDAVTEVKKAAPGTNPANGQPWDAVPPATKWEDLPL
jgi:hypothetical protein